MKYIKWLYYVIYEYYIRIIKFRYMYDGNIFTYIKKCNENRKEIKNKGKDWFWYAEKCHNSLKRGGK